MQELEKIATDCRAAADYYADSPGLAGAEAIIDLYRTIQRIAEQLAKQAALR